MPIESDTLPQQAIDYLNNIEANKLKEANQAGRLAARQELLQFCNSWFTTARTWRKQSYEDDWLRWQRNADGRYDPVLKSAKKDWQAKAFVDLTPSHRENIQAELFRLIAGSRPILEVMSRPGGDPEQAQNITDLELREFEKSRFEVEYNKVCEEKTTYGSGIARIYYKNKTDKRVVRVPQTEQLNILNPASVMRHMRGQPQVLGYENQTKEVTIYRGVCIEAIPLWDFFWDPKALHIKGHICLFRSSISLQEILNQVAKGEFMPESAMLMREMASNEVTPPDKSLLQMERGISDQAPRRVGNQKTWPDYELYGRIPQKMVYPLLKEPLPISSADELVPARVIFTEQAVLKVELNYDYDGEPPFYKDDYFPVAGRFIGRGIPEMLVNPQAVVNEVVNQRLDEGALALQEGIAVVEGAMVNPEDLLGGGPGLVVRLDAKKMGPHGDIRNAILPLGRPDVKSNAGFIEVHEWERMAQERTSANRVTLGVQGMMHDQNRTLGGQQMLKQTAGEKFAFIQMLSEFTFLYEVFKAYWKLIYQNLTPDDLVSAIGPRRAQTFQLLSPEEVESGYKYEPKGIFEREAKATRQARLAAMLQQFGGAPWFDKHANYELQMKSFDLDPALCEVPEAEMMEAQALAQQLAEPMAKQMVSQIILGQAVKDVERNMAEKIADDRDGAKEYKVKGVKDIAKPDEHQKAVDHAKAELAVKKGLVSPDEAKKRLKSKYG